MSPTPLAPEAAPLRVIPNQTDPLEPPDPSPVETEEKPTLEQGLGLYLGHGGAFPRGVEYPPAPTTTTVTTTVTTTATTTTGSGIEVGG